MTPVYTAESELDAQLVQDLLVSAGITVSLAGGALSVALTAFGPTSQLPWVMVGPTMLALGNGMSYPTLNLMMLDLFPQWRGAVVSAGSFLTLVLNAVVAATLTPVVGTSAQGFALAAMAMVVLALVSWSWHLAVVTRDGRVPARAEDLEPTDLM